MYVQFPLLPLHNEQILAKFTPPFPPPHADTPQRRHNAKPAALPAAGKNQNS
jgi:hypothetical protein